MLRPTRADFRALAGLAIPIVTANIGLMAMGVVDTIMVGHYSAEALAATAIGNFYFFTIAVVGMGILYVLDPVISQAVGARDERAITLGVQRGLILAAVLTVAIAGFLLAAGPVLRAMRQPAEIIPGAAAYAAIMVPGLFPFFVFWVLRQSLQALGIVAPLVTATIIANLVNAGANWVLIFGHLGFRPLGIVGAAAATSFSRILLPVIVLALTWRVMRPHLRPVRREALEWAPLARMFRVGLPIGLQQGLEVSAFTAMMLLMGWIGTIPLAAHQVAINLASLTFMVPMGVGGAAAVLVGRAIGAGDEEEARRAAVASIIAGVGFMVVSALALVLVPEIFASLYTNDERVFALAVILIPVAGFFQVFDGLQAVCVGVLRGIGDTRSPMVITILGYWLVGVPVSVWLGFRAGQGAAGVWWGSVVGLAAVGFLLLARVRSRMRRTMTRLVIDSAVDPAGEAASRA